MVLAPLSFKLSQLRKHPELCNSTKRTQRCDTPDHACLNTVTFIPSNRKRKLLWRRPRHAFFWRLTEVDIVSSGDRRNFKSKTPSRTLKNGSRRAAAHQKETSCRWKPVVENPRHEALPLVLYWRYLFCGPRYRSHKWFADVLMSCMNASQQLQTELGNKLEPVKAPFWTSTVLVSSPNHF